MESDAERGVGSSEDGELKNSSSLTIKGLNAGMDSIVAKAGTLPTLGSVATLVDFERRFKRALDATPFGCYPAMLLDVYEGTVGWSETDIDFVEKGWRVCNCLLPFLSLLTNSSFFTLNSLLRTRIHTQTGMWVSY